MKKVAIIFPKYNPSDSSHYPYWYKLFEKAGEELEICIQFESGQTANITSCKTITQKYQTKPFNLIERFIYITKLRNQGYKNFYIHYSIYSLFIAKFITLICGGKTYLWDCEFYDKLPINKFQILAIKLTDYLVTGHEVIAEQYKKILNLPNLKTKIVPNWAIEENDEKTVISKLRENKKRKSIEKNILFLHHLSERKGSKLLPQIIEKVLSKVNNAKFTLVGDGPDFDFTKKWIINNNLQKKVILKKSISQNQVSKEFNKADLFILPSLSEGFPRVILEAQKYGIPYVTFNVGCVKQISPINYQFIVEKNDLNSFTKKILTILSFTKKETNNISMELIKGSNKYNLELAVNKFIKIF